MIRRTSLLPATEETFQETVDAQCFASLKDLGSLGIPDLEEFPELHVHQRFVGEIQLGGYEGGILGPVEELLSPPSGSLDPEEDPSSANSPIFFLPAASIAIGKKSWRTSITVM